MVKMVSDFTRIVLMLFDIFLYLFFTVPIRYEEGKTGEPTVV